MVAATFRLRKVPMIEWIRFKSRKNRVFHLVNQNKVLKVFPEASLAEKEWRVLRQALERGVPVPKPLRLRKEQLWMEYIAGANLCDYLNACLDEKLIPTLSGWFVAFHRHAGQRHGDANLRNFILAGEKIYGVDFEETAPGDSILDLVQFACSVLDTDPMFTAAKYRFCQQFLCAYEKQMGTGIERLQFWQQVADLLRRKIAFRPEQALILKEEAIKIMNGKIV